MNSVFRIFGQQSYFITLVLIFSFELNCEILQTDTLKISLDQLISSAMTQNEKLLSGKAQIQKAELSVTESQVSYLPKIDGIFSYNYLDNVPASKIMQLGNIEHDLFPRLNIEQEIYNGGKTKLAILQKKEILKEKELSLFEIQEQTKLTIAANYFNLKSLNNQITILKNNRDRLLTQKKLTRILADAGKLSELDIARIELEISNADIKLIKLKNDYSSYSDNLLLLSGINDYKIIVPADSLNLTHSIPDLKESIEISRKNNITLKKLMSQIEQKKLDSEIVLSSKYPLVTASAYMGFEFGPEEFSFSRNDRYFVALNAKYPLFEGGLRSIKKQQIETDIKITGFEMEYIAKQLANTVNNIYRKIDELHKQIDEQKKMLEQTINYYKLALLEYQSGRRSSFELLDLQNKIQITEIELNDIEISCVLKSFELKYYLAAQ